MKLGVSRDSRWKTRLLPEAIRIIGPHLARACGGSDRGAKARDRGGLRKVGPDTVVEKLDQPPVPSAPSARPGRAPGGGRTRDARRGFARRDAPRK
eukprot:gene16934-biopygen5306